MGGRSHGGDDGDIHIVSHVSFVKTPLAVVMHGSKLDKSLYTDTYLLSFFWPGSGEHNELLQHSRKGEMPIMHDDE